MNTLLKENYHFDGDEVTVTASSAIAVPIIRKICRCCNDVALPGEIYCLEHLWQEVQAEHHAEGTK